MNHYVSREIKGPDGEGKGKWHYTCKRDGKVWPVGYCAQDCPGHDTPDEAYAHKKLYLLDKSLKLHPREMPEPKELIGVTIQACAECGEPTAGLAVVGFGMNREIPLCPVHCTREVVEKHFEVGESWSSY